MAVCLRARGQCARDEAAVQVHPGGQGQHVAVFLPGDRDRVLGEGSGDLLQRQAVLADLDEMVQQSALLAADAVIQADQQTIQPPGQVFVISRRPRASLRGRQGAGQPSQPGLRVTGRKAA